MKRAKKKPALVPVVLPDFRRRRMLAAARIAGLLPLNEVEARLILFEAGVLYERLISDDKPA